MPTSCVLPVHKVPQDYPTFRISPQDTNRLALMFDPVIADMSLTYCDDGLLVTVCKVPP